MADYAETRNGTTRIFLSYAGTDRDLARIVAQALEQTGLSVFWDKKDIGWGDNWQQRLQDALQDCQAFVILVGRSGIRTWVQAELGVALNRHFSADSINTRLPIYPLLLDGVESDALPPFLKLIQARALPPDPVCFDYRDLASAISESLPNTKTLELPKGVSPFRGLSPFRTEDKALFFGRQQDTHQALTRFGRGLDGRYRRWLQIEGDSGAGKSSLVNAAILPALQSGWHWAESGYKQWRILGPMRPGNEPLTNLAEALSRGLAPDREPLGMKNILRDLTDEAAREPEKNLAYLLRDHKPADEETALLLIIDQFEEIFSLTKDAAQKARFDALLAAALLDGASTLHVISSIRSDFLNFDSLPQLQQLLNDGAGRYQLPTISERGLREIVTLPVEMAGAYWSDDSLAEEIVQQAKGEPGALPLVENLLDHLWNTRVDNTLLRKHYDPATTELTTALARDADRLLDNLGREHERKRDRIKALNLLTSLVNINSDGTHTRRGISRADAIMIAGGDVRAETILNLLSGSTPEGESTATHQPLRLVSIHDHGSKVDLIHETLLRKNARGEPYWPTLWHHIENNRKRLNDRTRLELQASDWSRRHAWSRCVGLATGRSLRNFRKAFPSNRPEAERFLRWSRIANLTFNLAAATIFVLIVAYAEAFYFATQAGLSNSLALPRMTHWLSNPALPDMVQIPAGRFVMGATEEEINRGNRASDECCEHDVTIPAFDMSRTEATFKHYESFLLRQSYQPDRFRSGCGFPANSVEEYFTR